MQWYYTIQGQRLGPVDDAGLADLVRQGVILDDTYVWREGLAEWQLYGAVKPTPAPEPVVVPTPAPPPKSVDRPPPGAADSATFFLPEPEPAKPEAAKPQPAKPEPARLEPAKLEPAPAPRAAQPFVAQPAATKPRAAASDSYFFYYRVLRALGDGRVIRACVVWGLKIATFAVILIGLLSAGGILFASQAGGARALPGTLVLSVALLATSLCVAQVCWYRAGSVAALADADYTVIPIASILFRTGGECGATGFCGIGAGMCLFLWLSPGGLEGMDLRSLPLPIALPGMTGFVGGIVVLLYTSLLAFVSLISGYLAAEWIAVLVDIAESIHKIRKVAEKA
ncbi:MAG TPA: DUF4339 domain-containing protein [Bryobacteraceae bacterium]|jgi:hypothetical protein